MVSDAGIILRKLTLSRIDGIFREVCRDEIVNYKWHGATVEKDVTKKKTP